MLSQAGLKQCFDKTCTLASPEREIVTANAENPPLHYHLDDEDPEYGNTLQLYKKENRLWELEGLEPGPFFTDGPDKNLIFANHASIPGGGSPYVGQGRYAESLPLVRIPTPRRFLEALVLLLVRDRGTDAAIFWQAMITYMVEYVIEPGYLSLDSVDKTVAQYAKAQTYFDVSFRDSLDAATKALRDRAEKGLGINSKEHSAEEERTP